MWGGEFLWFLQQLGYTNLHGVDVSPQQIEAAKSIGVENVEVADALEYLRRYPNTYALINAQSFLEHLTRDELLRVMDATVKALLPGGLLLAVVPNSKSLFSARVRYADLTHELSFTPESVVQLCNLAGLEVVTIREHGPVVHGLKSAVRWMVWQVIRTGLLVALLAEAADISFRVYTQDMMFVARQKGSQA